ncbi:MAG: DUF5996 family protein [Chromatiales bacterium]|nr:DUF5996 family protein [Chromatiales bacterium]
MLNRETKISGWPQLPPLKEWDDTCATVHMWTQIIGKIHLAQGPWINHSWGAALYLTTRGLTTSLLPYGTSTFAIELDFVEHKLRITTDDGLMRSFDLEPMPVAVFYRRLMDELKTLGLTIDIYPKPVEVAQAIPFDQDREHSSYDRDVMNRYWRALLQAHRVFNEFRARFTGKVSPVHFFWGSFDLAVTRFSGRTAPKHPGGAPNCANWVMIEAYSHEVSSAGFWPGTSIGEACFYSYAYPEPQGFRSYSIAPKAAYYLPALGEYLLPYEAVRCAVDPDRALLEFLQSTYEAAAELAHWDRKRLEQRGSMPPATRAARRQELNRAKQ